MVVGRQYNYYNSYVLPTGTIEDCNGLKAIFIFREHTDPVTFLVRQGEVFWLILLSTKTGKTGPPGLDEEGA